MRVIGGLYRSRIIEMPKGSQIRPTQDRVREAVFNVLADIGGKRVLDLFAGSGAYGLEALSRGASHATFVENNSRCLATIESNVESLKIPRSAYRILRSSAYVAASRLEREGETYDLIFVDPPYHKDMAKKCLLYVDYHDIMALNCLVVVEHSKGDKLDADLNSIAPDREREYGDTFITIFKKIG